MNKDFSWLRIVNINETNSQAIFERIAKELMCKKQIKKGNTLYDFLEIECYYYCKDYPDVITYPRTCKTGKWFFHPSGVDLTFESNSGYNTYAENDKLQKDIKNKQNTDDTLYFGGILIRALRKHSEDKIGYIYGPQKCCEELFDYIDAFGNNEEQPILVECKDGQSIFQECEIKSCPRYHVYREDDNGVDKMFKKARQGFYVDFSRHDRPNEWGLPFYGRSYPNKDLPTVEDRWIKPIKKS